jgi:hypothetical protein
VLIILMAILILPLFPLDISRAQGGSLYEVSVPVEERSERARREAVRQGLRDVLVRVTGQRDPEREEALAELLEDAQRFVERFRFEDGAEGTVLSVSFDGDALDRAVANAGAPLWGRERPRTLIWMAVRDGHERRLLGRDDAGEQLPELLESARRRGLPLLFPLHDLEERRIVDFADIWAGFDDRVLEASRRYSPNAILIGRVDRVSGQRWQARWSLHQPDGVSRWREGPGTRLEVISEGIEQVADRFAERYAVTGDAGTGERVRLRIEGLGSLDAFAAAERQLRALTPVRGIVLEEMDRDAAIFIVDVRGGRYSLEQAMRLADRFSRVDTARQPSIAREPAGDAMVPVEPLATYRFRS